MTKEIKLTSKAYGTSRTPELRSTCLLQTTSLQQLDCLSMMLYVQPSMLATVWILLIFPALSKALAVPTTALGGIAAFTAPSLRTARVARRRRANLQCLRLRLRRQPHGVRDKDSLGRWVNCRSLDAYSTRMSLLRTFDASEIQLQRFIGELGFVEITDWFVSA